MADYKQYPYTVECPYLKKQHTINIEFAEFLMSGNLAPGYKKMGYSCEFDSECPHKDRYKRCIIYSDAPNNPNLL